MLSIHSPDMAWRKVWQKIPAHVKVTFFAAMIIGFLTHAFMLTNKFVNYDDIDQLFSTMHHGFLGRWFLWFPAAFSSSWAMPWVGGLLGMLYLAVAACFISVLLRVKTPVYCILLAALIQVFPVVACTFAFMNCADGFFFAVMLNCIAVYVTVRYRFGFCAGIVLLTCALGIYQAYFTVAAGLFVAILIFELLRGEKTKRVLLRGALYVLTLAAAMAAYFVMVQLTAGDTLRAYRGIHEMGQIRFSDIPTLIYHAYVDVLECFLRNRYTDQPFEMRYLFLLLAGVTGGLLIWLTVRKKIYRDIGRLVTLGILIALFPLAINVVHVMQGIEYQVYIMMVYGLVLAPIFCLEILQVANEETEKEKFKLTTIASWVAILSLAFCVYGYWIRCNQAYFKLHMVYEQGYAYSNTLLTRIQSTEGYTGEEEIIFVGRPQFGYGIPALNELHRMVGIPDSIPEYYSFTTYLRYYLGNTQTIHHLGQWPTTSITLEDLVETGLWQVFETMPFYPADGSILRLEDQILVRFSAL